MTWFPAVAAPTERKPLLLCDGCGAFVDLDNGNIETIRAAWLTVTRGRDKRHYCPVCKEERTGEESNGKR